MNDLDQTVELPHAAVWPKGVSKVSTLRPARPAADLEATADIPVPPRDPVVQAALAMMTAGHDRLAVVMTLADHYPGRCIKELDRIARETAVTLAAGGLIPAAHNQDPAQLTE